MFNTSKHRLHFSEIAIFYIVGYALLAFRNSQFDARALLFSLAAVLLLFTQYIIINAFFAEVNRPIVIAVNMLCAVSLIILYRLEPDLGIKQMIWVALGFSLMFVTAKVLAKLKNIDNRYFLYMGTGLTLLLITFVFGSVVGGAQNWIKLDSLGISLQPSEFVKIFLVLAVSSVFCKKRKFYVYVLGVIFTMISILLLVLANDLGAALLYFIVFLFIFYAGKNSAWLTLSAFGAFVLAAYISYFLFSHVQVRVDAWLHPWSDPNDRGYQIIQGLISMVSGGAFGSGLGIGSPRYVPAYETDYIFTAINEEMGIIMGLLIIGFYVIIAYEGIKIALKQNDSFYALIAFGSTALLSVQTFIILGGILRIMPLTGITLPFVSYGGSSIIISFVLAGIILSVGSKNSAEELKEEDA
ncbi:MAG: FtsW/RodA/SpoVE family cell cycle protein [Clostridia bacterium]|nr:FtsW/RodA/SpoVE family cell cycle protein [Clostridia bacterium]